MGKTVKVLVVDDSAFMRNAIRSMLVSDPQIEVVGMAKDGLEAVEMVQILKPDIVTMDVDMPKMDGVEALRQIMAKSPLPVLMLSSLTTEDAKVTLQALELGAVDFMPKNLSAMSVNILRLKEGLIEKIKQIARKGLPKYGPFHREPLVVPSGEGRTHILAIGTSTGGPKALQEIIPRLPGDLPMPVVIAQHMPASFTGPFAERLDQLSKVSVKEAEDGEPLKNGVVLVSPGGVHMKVRRRAGGDAAVEIVRESHDHLYRPSVDMLLISVAECYPGRTLGLILTGMGNDGLVGAGEVKKTGGRIFAQDEESSVVFGMPKAVIDAGLADRVLSIGQVAGEIMGAL